MCAEKFPNINITPVETETKNDFYKHRDEYILDATKNDLGYLYQQFNEGKIGLDIVKYESKRIVRELTIANDSNESEDVENTILTLRIINEEDDVENIKKNLLEAIHSF